MKLSWAIWVVLLIGVATHMGTAQEEANPEVGSQADPEVGSPLGGLVIAKGIKKLALFEGIKKIKLKLSKLGLKKGLFLAKIPWLASANPNADGGENMDGSDTYYIGIPEVGAHLWSGQNFDADFHPNLERFEVEDLQDWHNHLRYQHDPHVQNVHESEFITAHTEGHPMTEIYRFVEAHDQPIPYHNQHFTKTEQEFDPFEQEGQESRYYVASVRKPNESAIPAMSRDTSLNEGSDQMQNAQYTKYSPETMVQNVKEKPSLQSTQYHILNKDAQSKEISPEQIPIWYAPSDGSNSQSNLPSAPVQGMHTNQEAQAPMFVWNTNSNIPARAPAQEVQNSQLNQETQAPMYVWNTQKTGENSQPQMVVWQPSKSEEMVGPQNTVFDNMSHLPKEEGNVHPIIMQEYVQAVQGLDQGETSSKNPKYYENNVQMADQNSVIMPSEYVTKEGYATADDTEPKWTLLTIGATQEKEQTYTYPVKEATINSKSKIDVTSRISMEGAGIEKRQMVSKTCGSSAFTEAFARLAEASQNAQAAKSMAPSLPSQSQMINQGLSQYSNMNEQKDSERATDQQQMLSNQEVPQSSVDERTTTQGQDQMYYAMAPQQMMYQPVSGDLRTVDDQTPHVVIDNQPLSAFILPSEGQATAEVMPDHAAPRTAYAATKSQDQQDQQDDQLQHQAPATDSYYNPGITSQYSQPSGLQYTQYGYQQENPIAPIYKDDAAQYRSEAPDQEDQSYAMQTNEEEQNPNEADVGHMMPQVPEHARTFHKKFLFGLKKKNKFGGHKSIHYHYHTNGGYGGHGYGSYGYGGQGYGHGGYGHGGYGHGGYGHGGYGHGGYGQGGYGHGGHGYYSHGYGYLGQENPSGDAAQQESTQGQEMQDSAASHMSSNMEMMPSASNNDPEIMKPSEPMCPCARSWNEGLPAYHDDRRLENTNRLRHKRSVSRSNYLPQNQARCVQAAVRLSEKLAEPLPQRQICSNGQYQHSSIPDGFQSYSPYSNLETVVEPYSNPTYYNGEPSTNYCPLNQGYKELTIDANDPLKMDQEIYKKIMEHTEQSVREALAKASAEPLQISGDQIIANGDEVKQEPEIVHTSAFEGEGHTPVISLPPEQSLSATDILPAPSEKSVASYLPHDMPMSSYQYPSQYSNSLEKSPPFSALHGFGGVYPNLKPHIDPLEALKVFDMASTSGTTFHQLLDAIKAKLFACCEKCKDKILRGIHEKIEEEERDHLPSRSHREGSYECSSGKTLRDIYREVESLSRDIWTEELGYSWDNKGRRGDVKDKKSLSDKKQRLKKLAQFLLELKKCKCCSDESVEQYNSGEAITSGEQCSFEITSSRKINKTNKRGGKEGKTRSRKTKNSSASKGSKRNGRKKSKNGNAEEQVSISGLSDF